MSEKYIAPRGDSFYYIEVWDKQMLRDCKLSKILNMESNIKPKYVNGSLSNLVMCNLSSALFWKNIETAEFRIEYLSRNEKIKNTYIFKIKYFNREEFIKSIPGESTKASSKRISKYGEIAYWDRNRKMKEKEIGYLRKLKKNI